MLNSIKESFSDKNQVLIAGAGLALFSFYALYARKQIFAPEKKISHSTLELPLKTLINEPKNNLFKKIAITETSLNKSNLTGQVLSKVKAYLIGREITTLVNCSPIKILSAGCQCFLEALSNIDAEDEKQYISYYENAIRCQLLLEKTIVDIESIKKNKDTKVILCDNNSMDLKVRSSYSTWDRFLTENNLVESKLMENYDLVIHFQDIDENNEEADNQNKRIEELWGSYSKYYSYRYDRSLNYEENLERAFQFAVELIQPIIPELN